MSVMNVTDFGLKNSLVYHVAKELDRPIEVTRYFSVTMWIYLGLAALVLAATAMGGAAALCALLRVPARYRSEATFVVWITVFGFVWKLLSTPYQAVLEGRQELSASQWISCAWLLVYFLGNLVAVAFSPTIYGLGLAGLAGNVFLFLAYFLTARRRLPGLSFGRAPLEIAGLRRMIGFGAGLQVASLCIALREPLYKVLVARTFDLASVAAFDIAFKLCTQLMSAIATPLFGVFGAAAIFASHHEDLRTLLRPLLGLTIGMLLPTTLAVFSFAQPILRLWLGPEEGAVAALLPFMYAAFAGYYATEVLYRTIEGTGRSWYSAVVQTLVLAVQVGSFWLFASRGLESVLWSLSAGYAVFSVANVWMFRVLISGGRMFTAFQWMCLLVPSALYAACSTVASDALRVVLFALYLVGHFWCLFAGTVVDPALWRSRRAGQPLVHRPALAAGELE